MKKTAEDPHCLRTGTAPGLVDLLKRNNFTLESIARGLEEFLEVRLWCRPSHTANGAMSARVSGKHRRFIWKGLAGANADEDHYDVMSTSF